eukprot:765703-Hanusia_phi.AAC.2
MASKLPKLIRCCSLDRAVARGSGAEETRGYEEGTQKDSETLRDGHETLEEVILAELRHDQTGEGLQDAEEESKSRRDLPVLSPREKLPKLVRSQAGIRTEHDYLRCTPTPAACLSQDSNRTELAEAVILVKSFIEQVIDAIGKNKSFVEHHEETHPSFTMPSPLETVHNRESFMTPSKMEVVQDSTANVSGHRSDDEDVEEEVGVSLGPINEGLAKRRGVLIPTIMPGMEWSRMEEGEKRRDFVSEDEHGIHLTPFSPSSIRSRKRSIDSGEASISWQGNESKRFSEAAVKTPNGFWLPIKSLEGTQILELVEILDACNLVDEQDARGPGAWNPFTSSSNVILSSDRCTVQIGGGKSLLLQQLLSTAHRRPTRPRHRRGWIHKRNSPDPPQSFANEQVDAPALL